MGSNVSTQNYNYTIIGDNNRSDAAVLSKTDQRARLDAQLSPTGGLNPALAEFENIRAWQEFMDIQELREEDGTEFFGTLSKIGGKISGAIKLANNHLDKLSKIGAVIHETYGHPLIGVEDQSHTIADIDEFSDGYSGIIEGTYLRNTTTNVEGGTIIDSESSSGYNSIFSEYYGDWDTMESEYEAWYSGAKDAATRFMKRANQIATKVIKRPGTSNTDHVNAGAVTMRPETAKRAFSTGARAIVGAIKRGVDAEADVHGSVVSTRTVTGLPAGDHLQIVSKNISGPKVHKAVDRMNDVGRELGLQVVPSTTKRIEPKICGSTCLQETVDKTVTKYGTVQEVKNKVNTVIKRLSRVDTDLLLLTPKEIPVGMFPISSEEETLQLTDVFESLPISKTGLTGMSVRESGALSGKLSNPIDGTAAVFGSTSGASVKVINGRAHSYKVRPVFWGTGSQSDHDVHFSCELTTVVLFTSGNTCQYGCGLAVGVTRNSTTTLAIFPATYGDKQTQSNVEGVVVWQISLDLTGINKDGLQSVTTNLWTGTFVPVLYTTSTDVSKVQTCELGMQTSSVVVSPLVVYNYFIYNHSRVTDKRIFHIICRIQPHTATTSSKRDMLNYWFKLCDVFDGVIGMMADIFNRNEHLAIIPARMKCLLQSMGVVHRGSVVSTTADAGQWLASAVRSIRRWPFVWAGNPFRGLREEGKHEEAEDLAAIIYLMLVKVVPLTAFTDTEIDYRRAVAHEVRRLQRWEGDLVKSLTA
uniref:VP4 protein n=1 Tax=Calla Lily Valley virus TaxID=3139873 RepID=A0AAN0LQS3_9VIRU